MINRLIPSMFLRRLLLLLGAVGVVFIGLGVRLGQLTVAQGASWRAKAERALVSERWTPASRGRVLDRKGRVLAQDLPSFDVAVDYDVITGERAFRDAARAARRAMGPNWRLLSSEERERAIADRAADEERALDVSWDALARASGVPRDDLEQRKSDVMAEVQRLTSHVWSRAREKRERELLASTGEPVEVPLSDVARPLREQKTAHVLLRGVDDHTAFEIRRLADTMPGLRIIDSGAREYPFETMHVVVPRDSFPRDLRTEHPAAVEVRGVATHVLGWMRNKVFAEDLAARPLIDPGTGEIDPGHYREGDSIGQAGVERGYEGTLRGMRGRSVLHLDTGEREDIPPTAGSDVRLTLDIMLQARVQALMSPELGLARLQPWHMSATNPLPLPLNSPINGAAVVLDVQTGHILAMVTTPSFTREDLERDSRAIFENAVDHPWVNRAIGAPYPPGSIIKAAWLAAGVSSGAWSLDRGVECTGHLYPDQPAAFRCWIYKQFLTTHTAQLGGPLHATQALCVSCNIYFYNVARSMGPQRIVEWAKKFGVGSGWDLGVGPEAVGFLGPISGGEVSPSDAIHMGIGQGPIAWTPLHAADALATIAREGLRLAPRIDSDKPARPEDLRFSQEAARQAREGLHLAVTDRLGTGAFLPGDGAWAREPIFNAPGIDVFGKTGTAEAPDLVIDPDDDGPLAAQTVRAGDHSWFVVVASPAGGGPMYAIAVIMEYAGSGGRVSGPICNQIVRALIEEGYLPRSKPLALMGHEP
ncbi:MAG: peptidoglycan D,D-transpeptidase FtsI family protein [Phycisphaerales bacterium]